MGLMDFIRRVGSSIQGAAQKGFAFAKKGADAVKNIYNKATLRQGTITSIDHNLV